MKYLALPLLLLLTGCGNLAKEMSYLTDDMLETAPKTDFEVRYPNWGDAPQLASSGVKGPMGQMRTTSYSDLQGFLLKNGVDYEVLPGNHVMVKLNHHVNFKTGSAIPAPVNDHWLDTLGSYLSQRSDIDIVIEGHTDNTGNDQINDPLSEQRAKEVKARLERNYVSSQSIYTRGFGEYVPACTNTSSQGKACNRRVELMLIVAK